MTDAPDYDAIEARANAATEGPWRWTKEPGDDGMYEYLEGPDREADFVLSATGLHTEGWMDADAADADFIAHARTDIPALIARCRELEARLTFQICGGYPVGHSRNGTFRDSGKCRYAGTSCSPNWT